MSTSAMLKINCPSCQKRLQIPQSEKPRSAPCPNCKSLISIPGENPAPFPAPFLAPLESPFRQPKRVSLRTVIEIGMVLVAMMAGTAWLGLRMLQWEHGSPAGNRVEDYDQIRMYNLMTKASDLEERKGELTGKINALKEEIATLDRAIQQSLHNSQVKVDEVLAAFDKGAKK